jgi:hypothetical protein
VNHADVRARMADYLEGQLALTDRALLDAHLDGCPECSADIAEMRATIGLLRSLPEPPVPGDFSANVMRRIRSGEATPGLLDRIAGFFQDITQPRVLVPVSAALLSAGFVLWGQQAGFFLEGGARTRAANTDVAAVSRSEALATRGEVRRAGTASASSGEMMQVAGLAGSSSVRASELSGDASTPYPIMHVTISLEAAPPPYQIEPLQPAPVRIPFRADWGSANSPGSIAVASTPTTSLGETMSMEGSRVLMPAASSDRYGVGTDPTRSEPRSRDDWLQILEASPAEFAQRLSRLTLAEQELWIDRLARHAAAQGSLDRVVERLRSAGGDVGQLLADDFAAVGESSGE